MNHKERCEYIHKEGGRIHGVTMDLVNSFQKTEGDFMSLSTILFCKENTKYFSQIIPEEYHPWNVSERVHNSIGLTSRSVYEEAIQVYESALLPILAIIKVGKSKSVGTLEAIAILLNDPNPTSH